MSFITANRANTRYYDGAGMHTNLSYSNSKGVDNCFALAVGTGTKYSLHYNLREFVILHMTVILKFRAPKL